MGAYDKSKFFDVRTYKKPENEQSNYYDVRKAYVYDNIEKISQSISSRVNSWYQKSSAFFNESANRYKSRTGTYKDAYVSDSADYLAYATKRKSELEAEYNEVNAYIKKYADYLDKDAVNSTVSSLKKAYSEIDNILNAANSDVKYWSQWKDEKSYKTWADGQKLNEEYAAVDIESERNTYNRYQKELSEAKKWQNELTNIYEWRLSNAEEAFKASGGIIDEEEAKALEKYKADVRNAEAHIMLLTAGKGVDEFEKYLSERNAYLTNAERYQKGVELASAVNAPDFKEYAQQGEALGVDPKGFKKAENTVAYLRNNPSELEKYRSASESAGKNGSGLFGKVFATNTLLDRIEYKAAAHMTEEQFKIYNYYFAKDPKKAEQYLESIEETLNAQQAAGIVAEKGDNTFSKLIFGAEAGLDNFRSGATNLFSNEDYYIPSSTQIAGNVFREDLGESGVKLPDWLGGGSLGQVAYDALNTTANQLPSILASTAANILLPGSGAVVGNVLMGASAAGNAKAEMVNLGYTKEQANSYGLLVGASESLLQYALGGVSALGGKLSGGALEKVLSKVDNAFARVAISTGGNMLSEGIEEGLQTILEPWFESIVTKADFEAPNIDEVLYSSLLGALSAGILENLNIGSSDTTIGAIGTTIEGNKIQKVEGGVNSLKDIVLSFKSGVTESLDSAAYKLANKVNGKTDAYTIGRLYREVGATLSQQNKADIIKGLTDRGIRETDAKKIATSYEAYLNTKVQLSPEERTVFESLEPLSAVLRNNIIGENTPVYQRTQAFSDLSQNMSKSSKVNTENVNADTEAKPDIDADTLALYEQIKSDVANDNLSAAERILASEGIVSPSQAETVSASKDATVQKGATATNEAVSTTSSEMEQVEDVHSDGAITIEEVAKSDEYKASPSVATMVQAYESGQDASRFASEYDRVFNYAYSGTMSLDRVTKSGNFSTLTQDQIKAAYNAGANAAKTKAEGRDNVIRTLANGKTGRKKGVVKGDGVSINDLRSTFNDTQNVAYKVLSRIAEVTGIDIVLYKSETNEKGEFVGAQGKYDRGNDPGTIHIDINAGLKGISDVGRLTRYTMLRTFSHEFSHFIENFNPIWYNELRSAVFEQLTEYGEDVDGLIQTKMEQSGLDYDRASREVVAQALTDVLDDSSFVNNLAEKHKNVFNKLLEKLKEFLADIKAYFASIETNNAKEARAMKKQIGDAMHYVESIVELFDKAAVGAVENYQQTVAVDEALDEVVAEDSKATEEAAATKDAMTTEYEHFTITDNAEYGSLEIKFDGKPSEAVRNVLKEHKFRWHKVKGVWYGKGERADIASALDKAYAEESTENQSSAEKIDSTNANSAQESASLNTKTEPTFTEIFENATQAEKDEVVEAINKNTKLSHMAPTEIRGETKEAIPNGRENAYNQGTVENAETDGQGASRVLDEVETEDVQRNASERDSLEGAEERRREVGRDDVRPDSDAEARGGSSEGDSQSGDLRRNDRITSHKEAVKYAEERGYRVEINKLSAAKNVVQADIYDKQGLPTFNPIIIGELGKSGEEAKSNWNKVKEAIDIREESEKAKAEQFHEEVKQEIEQKSTEQPKGKNFVIGDSLDLPNGEKARYKANIEAIRLVKKLEAEGRYATEAEQIILSKYVGWGGLANAFDERKADWAKEFKELKELLTDEEYSLARGSTLNAHYTEISVIKAMYDGLEGLGFNGGRMLEPSSGVGNFVGAMPASMAAKVKSFTMVELDGITGLIAKYLYPNADVRIQGFEKANIPNNYMDVAISNVPFGNYPISDKSYPNKVTSAIHNYFFAKSIDKVRPGGIVMFITSAYTMNSKDSTVRQYIMKHADLLGAIRLPDTAFKGNAGTEVVTDILVLKKRVPGTPYAGADFLNADYQYIDGYRGAYINNYFKEHPEMALGTPSMAGGMYRGDSLTYKALEGKGTLADQIREAFKHIEGKMDYPAQPSKEKTNFAVEKASKKAKENGYVVKDGKVYQNENGELVEKQVAKGVAQRIEGILSIRDSAKKLLTYQQQGLKEDVIKAEREKLNKLYDDFVKTNGLLSSNANRSAISEDPDSFFILALENYNAKTKKATKADIFSVNTVTPNRTVTSANSVAEGLIVSRNETGGVDTALIAKLTNKSEADVTRELIDSRLAFKNRDGVLEPAETYLSGNVRAKLRDAQGLVPIDADYKHNVEALEAIIPRDIGYQEIFVNPGTPWIPNSVYSDFAAYMLGGRNSEYRNDVEIRRNETGNFTVQLNSSYLKYNASNTQKWGTPKRSFLDLFDAMLNSRSVVVKYKTDDGQTIVDKDATAAANEKIENIQKEFSEWLWKDEARRSELSKLYNEVFNSIVTPKYNGENFAVNGMRAGWDLRPHQKDAVQRVVSSGGNTLLAHKVGAGKTFEMAASAMKLKELGLIKKPMFVVPKSLVAQWGKEFTDLFPAAKLLVTDAKEFTASNRKIYANKIANGVYDAVIVSYEQFEKLPMSEDYVKQFYQEQIDTIIDAINEQKAEQGKNSLSVKDLEKKKKSLEVKLQKLNSKPKDENNIEFEQLGVDGLFVDEAHNFKNLFYTTSMTNVSGLGNKDGSNRAFDLYAKVRYLQQLNGGRGIVFATATPVMNSMSEMYIMQKYLQPDLLKQLGLDTFDAWAKQFGEVVNGVEIKPSGQGYRVKQSFSRFKNLSELQLLFRNFADVLTDIPGLKIPKMKGGRVKVVECEAGQFQKDFMKELEKRADNVKNVDPSVDNMLKITSDGRKISYTQRMIDPTLPYEEGCKIYKCADNVVQEYKASKSINGTQIVFMDMATPKGKSKADAEDVEMDTDSAKLYEDFRARLIKLGIPANEIAFIHDADTDSKKKDLFANVNDGKVRVLIGSTAKMGVGMNAQKRMVAIHHLDAPWRPGDVEQRDGRVFRQGNINDEVSKYTYVTVGSFDARLWDILDRKSGFINQIMNGDNVGRETEDTGEVTLSAAEVKALASGSPLILEQVQLDTDIKKLESLYRSHVQALANARNKLAKDQADIAMYEGKIEAGKEDIKNRTDTYLEGKFAITIGKNKYTDKKEAGVALIAEAQSKATWTEYNTIGKFAGFDLRVIRTNEGISGVLVGKQSYLFKTYPDSTTVGINHLISQVDGISSNIENWQEIIKNLRSDMAEQETLMNVPFAKQAELDQKRARYKEVMEILSPKEEQKLESIDEDVQEQSRKYLDDEKPKRNNKRSKYSETETLFMIWANGSAPVGEIKRFFRFGKIHFYEKTDSGCVELSQAQYDERSRYNGENTYRRAERETGKTADLDGSTQKGQLDNSISDRNAGGIANIPKQALGEELRNDTRGSVSGSRRSDNGDAITESLTDSDTQNQNRSDTLTDTEVLEQATSLIDSKELTEGERSAFDIWQKHLTNIRELEDQRAELGTLYKEQNFTKGADHKEAAKTLERMKILDGKLKAESDKLFEIEQKSVLQSILKKARKVVEQSERAHGQELLKRYRERRENAQAIRKYRDRIKADVSELSKWILHPDNKNNLKHVPDVLKNTVIDFLTSVDFTSQKQLAGKGVTKADEAFAQRMKALRSAMKEDLDVGGIYSGYNDLPDDFMETLDKFIEITEKLAKSAGTDFVINKMSAEELRSLSKIVKNLKKFVTMFNAFHSNAIYQHVSDAGDNAIEFMQGITPATNTNKTTNFLFWQQMRPAYAFERFGEGGKAIYDGLRRGHAKLSFNTKKIVEFAEKTYTAEEVKAWEKAEQVIKLPNGGTIRMKVSQIMGFYELSKQPDSLRHILEGGIRVATYKGGENDRGRALTYADIEAIVEALTPRQKEVADAMQKFMAEQGGKWGNYVTMARFGEEQFTNSQYYPINSDGRLLDVNADEKPGGAELYALLNLSFTKSRNENANNRIVVYSIFDVFSNHMSSMAQYNALALPVLDAVKWLNYKQVEVDEAGNKMVLGRVREEMNVAYGTPEENGKNAKGYAESFVINIIKAFNGTAAQGTPYDGKGLKLLHKYNRAQIAYNVRVVVQQPMAITRAAMLLDYNSIIKGMKLSPSAIKANIEEMREHSGIAVWKALGFYDVNISRGVTSLIKQKETKLDKIVEFGMKGAEAADTLTWQAIWSACKEQVQRKQKLNPNDKGYFDAVTTLFEDVIYKTQVVDSILTKTEFMRDKGFWARATGSFMSEPTTTASMILDVYDKFRLDMRRGMSFKDAWGKNGRAIGRLTVVYGIGAIMLAAAQGVIDAYRDDDEYEEWYEKWLEAFRGNLVDELMPFNKLPYLSQFYEFVKELISVGGFDIYGQMANLPFVEIAEKFIQGVQIIYDNATDNDTNYTYYGGIYKLLQAASGISGLPISTATRTVIGAWNNTVGAMAPSLKVKDYDVGPFADIKYAFKDGYLSEEEATKLLLEEGLAEDENEAYYYIQEWSDEDGKYSKYDALKDALASGEGFDDAMNELITHGKTEKEVISQVKSIVGKMVKEEGLSEDEAIRLLMEYADLDNDEARKKVDYWAFVRDNPKGYDRLNEDSYAKYKEMCEPYGVSIDTYYKAYTFRNDTDNDEGLTPAQKKRKIRDYIYQMDIPTDHKRKLIACWFK